MLFHQRYDQKDILGKGSFGIVYLVQDLQDQNKQKYALKIIPKHLIRDNLYYKELVKGEIECLKIMNSPNIIKLHQNFQTKDDYHLLMEYCDLGNLQAYILNKEPKVLSLEQATEIMIGVIKGLESMHSAGFLHRDIKPQNILIKNQNGQKVVKIGDLGLSKMADKINGTQVGTVFFMSPQILGGKKYGFEVDMWAFGVLFYYILNGQLLFKLSWRNNNSTLTTKQSLELEAHGFSYRKTVQKSQSKFKFNQNCTDEIQDLFKRIFEVNPNKRITFSELRQHPVFSKHFKIDSKTSKIYERNRFNSKMKSVKAEIMQGQSYNKQMENTEIYMTIHKDYPNQSQVLLRKKNQINFINHCAQIFYKEKKILSDSERLMICYLLKKYYLLFLRNFKNSLKKSNLANNYPDIIWRKITKTIQFKQFKNTINSELIQTSIQLISLHDQCEKVKDSIIEISENFQLFCKLSIDQSQSPETFKNCFRQCCFIIYKTMKSMLQIRKYQNQQEKHKIWFLTTLLIFIYSYNRIIQARKHLGITFSQYFQQSKASPEEFLFMDLFYWLQKQDSKLLNHKINTILNNFFQKK